MNQGEVRWCTFTEPDHARQAVILTRDDSISHLNTVTVAPITSKRRGVLSRVAVDENDGLSEPLEVNARNLQTIPKRMVGAWISTLSSSRMREVNAAIAYSLGFDRYE